MTRIGGQASQLQFERAQICEIPRENRASQLGEASRNSMLKYCCADQVVGCAVVEVIAEPGQTIENLCPSKEIQRRDNRIEATKHVYGPIRAKRVQTTSELSDIFNPRKHRVPEFLFSNADDGEPKKIRGIPHDIVN